jgi:hypothetical protein
MFRGMVGVEGDDSVGSGWFSVYREFGEDIKVGDVNVEEINMFVYGLFHRER